MAVPSHTTAMNEKKIRPFYFLTDYVIERLIIQNFSIVLIKI